MPPRPESNTPMGSVQGMNLPPCDRVSSIIPRPPVEGNRFHRTFTKYRLACGTGRAIVYTISNYSKRIEANAMPAAYTHYRFGRDVLPLLPPETRQIIAAHRALYD